MHTTLPRRFYADPEFYCAELERFYFNRWICAGRADQIPKAGDYFTRSLRDESVIVTRDGSGEIHALFNVCRHRGTRLCERPEGHLVEPFSAHITTGRTTSPAGCSLRRTCRRISARTSTRCTVPAASSGTAMCSCILASPLLPVLSFLPFLPFVISFADLPQRCRRVAMATSPRRRIVYNVKANWKLIVLNYNECLHCPNLHPALNKLHHYLGADNVAPTASYCGGAMGFRDGVETMSVDGKRRREYLPGLAGAQRRQVAYFRSIRTFSSAASRLRDDAHPVAARARSDRDHLASGTSTRTSSPDRTFTRMTRSSSGPDEPPGLVDRGAVAGRHHVARLSARPLLGARRIALVVRSDCPARRRHVTDI